MNWTSVDASAPIPLALEGILEDLSLDPEGLELDDRYVWRSDDPDGVGAFWAVGMAPGPVLYVLIVPAWSRTGPTEYVCDSRGFAEPGDGSDFLAWATTRTLRRIAENGPAVNFVPETGGDPRCD